MAGLIIYRILFINIGPVLTRKQMAFNTAAYPG